MDAETRDVVALLLAALRHAMECHGIDDDGMFPFGEGFMYYGDTIAKADIWEERQCPPSC